MSFTRRAASSFSPGNGEFRRAKYVNAFFQSTHEFDCPREDAAACPSLLWYIFGLSLSPWVGPSSGVMWNFCEKAEILSKGSYFHTSGMRPCLNAMTIWPMKVCCSSMAALPSGPVLYLICVYKFLKSPTVNLVDSIWSLGTWTARK